MRFLRYATAVHTLLWDSFCDIDPIVQIFSVSTADYSQYTHVFLKHATHKFAVFGTMGVPNDKESAKERID